MSDYSDFYDEIDWNEAIKTTDAATSKAGPADLVAVSAVNLTERDKHKADDIELALLYDLLERDTEVLGDIEDTVAVMGETTRAGRTLFEQFR